MDHAVQDNVAQMLFQNASRAVDSLAAVHEVQDPAGLKAQLKTLASQRPLSFEAAAFEAYDKVNKRATCSITIDYALQPSDKTPEGKAEMEKIHGLDAPTDLLGDAPKSQIKFTVQPSPDGNGKVVMVEDAHEPSSALLLVAMTRQRRTHNGSL